MVSETSLLTEFMAEVVLESGLCRKLFSFDVETYTACGEDLVKRVLAAKILFYMAIAQGPVECNKKYKKEKG